MRNQREETDQYFAATEMGKDSVADEYTKGKGQAMDYPLAAACRGPGIQSHRQLLAGAWRTPAGRGNVVALSGSLASHCRGNSIFHIQAGPWLLGVMICTSAPNHTRYSGCHSS
ncbi:hypothetical protein PAHAL_9G394000 [Panicum hallii]|uniref:Uncharacterized protein n=1 Tax=Panicum hallii TaxID=206008 RepID=A0A2S3INV1_9POAL|nr:hypothetical protein PAHAL_9G394000 [Panicum hallii]